MATSIYQNPLMVVFVLFVLVILLRKKLDQIDRSVRRLFRRQRKLQDEGDQVLGRHLMDSSANEKSQFVPPPVQTGKPYHMTMGLKRLDMGNWLTIDSEYTSEHNIRKELLDNSLPSVVQCLPGSEPACTETLQLVIDFLVSRYPETFILSGSNDSLCIHNQATQESFSLVDVANPLELAARLAMEDFNIVMKDPSDGQYHLMASATLFPVGWNLQERIGGTLAALHKPVPQWQEKLSCPVHRYFDRLSPTSTMERSTTFIRTTPALHLTTPFTTSLSHTPSISKTSTTDPNPNPNSNSDHMHIPTSTTLPPETIILRNERQTFRRLPQSQAILFTVHTYTKPLLSLTDNELTDFVLEMRGWPEETARYKGRGVWGRTVEEYLGKRGSARGR